MNKITRLLLLCLIPVSVYAQSGTPAGTPSATSSTPTTEFTSRQRTGSTANVRSTSDGLKIGEAIDDRISFYGADCVSQPPNTATARGALELLGLIQREGLGINGLTALTDNTGGTVSSTLTASVGIQTLIFPIQLASMTTAAADLMTNYVPGYKFKVLSIEFVTTTLGTGTSASQVLNMEIGTTNLTGGVLTLLLADTDTLGKKTAATAITAANTGTATDTLSIEVAASGTVFTAGAGNLIIKIQNMSTADAAASTASLLNSVRSGL